MDDQTFLVYDWPYLLTLLPDESQLEETAASMGALRRKRSVDSASTLLRLAFAYGFLGYSLRQTAAWAQMAGVADLSDVALLKRLRSASDWLGYLVEYKLAERAAIPTSLPYNLRLIDATTISRPKSEGLDWRVHLVYDLARLHLQDVELTDPHGGESMTRFKWSENDLVIGDRGYGHRRGMTAVASAGGFFIIRLNWQNVPLEKTNGHSFSLIGFLRGLPEAKPGEIDVQVKADKVNKLPALTCRLAALRKSEASAEKARQSIIAQARKKGRQVNPLTLETAGYIFVLTTLPPSVSTDQVLDLYRYRWQIELAFKRMKSLISLGEMPAKDPLLARSLIYSKLLAALLLDDLTDRFLDFFPWGYRLQKSSSIAMENPKSNS